VHSMCALQTLGALHLVCAFMVGVENTDKRRTTMIDQARDVLAEAKYREELARTAAGCIAGALAWGLREQGLTDKAIGETLGVSRNRVGDLVDAGMYPTICSDMRLGDDRQREYVTAEVEAVYGPLARPASGWTHTKTAASGTVAKTNGIPLPATVRDPEHLSLSGAQFDNLDTGERILVYTLDRHYGQPLLDANLRRVGADHRGEYRIDLWSSPGGVHPYPLEILNIQAADLRFGKNWDSPKERRTDEQAYLNAIRAVRRHYGIWPRPGLTEHAEDLAT